VALAYRIRNPGIWSEVKIKNRSIPLTGSWTIGGYGIGSTAFLAKVIGPYCMIVSAAFLLHREDYQKVVEGFLNNEGVKYLGAFLALLIGLLIVNTHNVWEASWVVLITLIGWISIIKGIWLLMFPNNVRRFMEAYQKDSTFLKVQLCWTFILGVFLTYKGYF